MNTPQDGTIVVQEKDGSSWEEETNLSNLLLREVISKLSCSDNVGQFFSSADFYFTQNGRAIEDLVSTDDSQYLNLKIRLRGGMDRQNRVGSKFGGGGVSSDQHTERARKERLKQLALESIDLAKDPYLIRNHLGSYECKLCLTLHRYVLLLCFLFTLLFPTLLLTNLSEMNLIISPIHKVRSTSKVSLVELISRSSRLSGRELPLSLPRERQRNEK